MPFVFCLQVLKEWILSVNHSSISAIGSFLIRRKFSTLTQSPNPIVPEMTSVGNDCFNPWVCVLSTSLPLFCTICLTISILTLTVTVLGQPVRTMPSPPHLVSSFPKLLEELGTPYTLRPDSMKLFLYITFPAFYEAKLRIRGGSE